MDVCNALIEQHLHHPTWTRPGRLRDFAVRGAWSRTTLLALALDAALHDSQSRCGSVRAVQTDPFSIIESEEDLSQLKQYEIMQYQE